MKIGPKMTKLQFAMLLVTFLDHPVYWKKNNCIYTGVNYMCLRARPNCVELWTSTRYIIVTANVTIIAVDERMLFLNHTWN